MAIEIKKSKEGSFTEYARRHGGLESNGTPSLAFARKAEADPDATEAIKKKARFMINASKWEK